MSGYLLVTAAGRSVGLPVEYLEAVTECGACSVVPSAEPALRGVATVRGTTVPVVHLGTLLTGGVPPAERGETAVLVTIGGRKLCLEVDNADIVVHEPAMPVPPDAAMPWARAVVRRPEGLVPLLDLTALGARLMEAGTG